MRITNRTEIAIKCMFHLALNDNEPPISIADLSKIVGASQSYLEQVFAVLRKNRLVISQRGPGGGYACGMLPDTITIHDIAACFDKPSLSVKFTIAGKVETLTYMANTKISAKLDSITLAEIIKEYKLKF